MPESRHRTRIEIKAESRDVKNLGRELERTFDPRHVDAFEQALSRSTEALAKLFQFQTKLGEKLDQAGKAKPPPLPGTTRARQTWERKVAEEDRRNREYERKQQEGRRGPGFGTIFGGTAAGTFAGHALYGSMQRVGGLTAAVAQGEGAINAALRAIPVVGETMSAAVERAQQLYQYFLAEQEAVGQTYGVTGARGLGRFRGAAQQFGIAGPQAAALLGGFGQTARMEGGELMQAAPQFIEAQKLYGVDLAGLVGAGRAAGGITRGPEAELKIGIKEGFKAGFDASEMPRYFQSMSGTLTEIRERGIDLNIGALQDLVSFFGRRGLRAGAAMRAAQGVAGGGLVGEMQQESIGGLMGFMAARRALMKEHERDRYQQYGLDYMSVMAFAEEQPQVLMREMEQDPALTGKSEAFKAFMYRQMMPQLPFAAARQLAAGERGFGDIGEEQEAEERRAEFMEGRRRGKGAAFGAAAFAAGRINIQAQYGADVAKSVEAIQKFELSLTRTLLPAIEGFTSRVGAAASATLEAVKNMSSAFEIPGILIDFMKIMLTGSAEAPKTKRPWKDIEEETMEEAKGRAAVLGAEGVGGGGVPKESMDALINWITGSKEETKSVEGEGTKGAAAHLRKSAEHSAKAAIILDTINIEGNAPTDLEIQ